MPPEAKTIRLETRTQPEDFRPSLVPGYTPYEKTGSQTLLPPWRRISTEVFLSVGIIIFALGCFVAERIFDAAPMVDLSSVKLNTIAAEPVKIIQAPLKIESIDEKTLEMVAPALNLPDTLHTPSETGPNTTGLNIVVSKGAGVIDVDSVTIEDLEHLTALSPNDAKISARLGEALAKQGDAEAAVAPLTKAALLAPENERYAYNLATLLDRLGYKKEAATYYGKVLDLLGPTAYGTDIPIAAVKARLIYLTQ